ncbi:MAG: NTP transferase domain-containing protein [Candidatus Riflebacteria bacterium]|nr:NTP transferase domain-containing protein [Candidatus Riflebacteria bacterium]
MKIILPVAGKGTRLRPHTFSKPKSLVRVAGKTVLQHVLDGLKPLKAEEYIFIVDENGHIIEKYVEERYPELKAYYVEQKEQLGPAHAVSLASEHISEGDDLLIVFNDTLFVTDLSRIPFLCEGLDGLIYSKEVEDPKRFGVNVVKNGIITEMVEKPDTFVSNLAQVGMYYLKDGLLFMKYLKQSIESGLRTKGEFYLPAAFELMIKDGYKFGAPEIEEWLDCGKPDTLLKTNRYLLERAPSNHKCIEGCVIIPPVSIHPRAEVSHAVIGPYVSVAEDCRISDCIIKDSVISAGAVLQNVILEDSIIGDSAELYGQSQRLNIGDNSILDFTPYRK